MRDHSQWSVSLGRWGGVQVQLHLCFLLFAVFTLYLSWSAGGEGHRDLYLWLGGVSVLVLALSVLAHEWGHVIAAQRLGSAVEQIVLWPLGGLAAPDRPRDPHADLLIQLAGPFANLALAALVAPVLLYDDPAMLVGLLNPLQPAADLTDGSVWLVSAKLIFWVNWVLALVNLVPAFPLDGGRILRAAILCRWGEEHRQRATLFVSLAAQVLAVLLLVAAWLTREWHPASVLPTWFALTILAIFLFFAAQHERQRPPPRVDSEDQPFGYDFSQGYTSLDRSFDEVHDESGPIAKWLEERREARQKRQQEIELEEDRKMDELLARICIDGIQSLTPEERLLLERVSARYRQRHEKE
jgi:Zn-dependent protease